MASKETELRLTSSFETPKYPMKQTDALAIICVGNFQLGIKIVEIVFLDQSGSNICIYRKKKRERESAVDLMRYICCKNSTTHILCTNLPHCLMWNYHFILLEIVQMNWIFASYLSARCGLAAYILYFRFLVSHFQRCIDFHRFIYPSHAQSYANLFSALSDSFPIQIITCVRNIGSFFFFFLFPFFFTYICFILSGIGICFVLWLVLVDWKRQT